MWWPTPYADAEFVPAPTDPSPATENDAPVPDEATLTNLTVDGTVPAALSGRYIRIGPNPTTAMATARRNLDGMVHAVDLHVGRALGYRNRWIATDQVAAVLGAEPTPEAPAAGYDSVATNVIIFGGRTLALGPGALAYELDAQLGTVGRVDLAGHGRGIGAHPQIDPMTGALHLVSHNDEPAHHIVAPNSQTRITSPVNDAPGLLHDLLLTDERLVLIGEGFIGITDRGGQATTRWAVGAHEIAGGVAAHDDGAAVAVLSARGSLLRWTVDGAGVECAVLDDTSQRFATTNPNRATAPRYLWTVAGTGGTEVYCHDLRTGDRTVHDLGPGRHPGELTFVPDDARRHREDGGWLIGFVHDDHRNEGDLVVLDAAALDRPAIATVRVPRRIPSGLHGAWIPAS